MFKYRKVFTLLLAFAMVIGVFAPVAHGQALTDSKAGLADKIIDTGEKYLGTPYDFGAPYGQTQTFDCSSFTKTIFAKNGIDLPRVSRDQADVGQYVPRSELQKGDLVFFSTRDSDGRIAHVGVYVGGGKVLHTWGPGGVRFESMNSGWLDDAYITARRVL